MVVYSDSAWSHTHMKSSFLTQLYTQQDAPICTAFLAKKCLASCPKLDQPPEKRRQWLPCCGNGLSFTQPDFGHIGWWSTRTQSSWRPPPPLSPARRHWVWVVGCPHRNCWYTCRCAQCPQHPPGMQHRSTASWRGRRPPSLALQWMRRHEAHLQAVSIFIPVICCSSFDDDACGHHHCRLAAHVDVCMR